MKARMLMMIVALPTLARAADLPLPEAPVRIVIPDAAAFDAALTGAYRNALSGKPAESDPLATAWRQTQVGTKLETQWSKFSSDLPWTWDEIRALKPSALGLALLNVGHLEAVLVVETPLAALPASLPKGETKTHEGATYHLVAVGAADESEDPERRMGLAWARREGRLFLATSERAVKLALDAASSGAGFPPPLPGLVSLDLDLDALRGNLYFRREFLFGEGPEKGHVRAALRLEDGHIVEVREGMGESPSPGFVFRVADAAAAGWEAGGEGLWPAFRAGLLEPIPVLSDRPVARVAALPVVGVAREDRYLVNLEKPRPTAGGPAGEEGDLAQWSALLGKNRVDGWGYVLGKDGGRRVVFAWPEAQDEELVGLCRATVERRGGSVTIAQVGDTRELRVGPDLPALAFRRTGRFVWLGSSARDLAGLPQPEPSTDVVRWGTVDLGAVRAEGARWQKAEGPASPERIRPLSDRILGLLGWMPKTTSLSVERRKTPTGWSERVVFGGTP